MLLRKKIITASLSIFIVASAIFYTNNNSVVQADTVSDLQQQIAAHNSTIQQLEQEISQYQTALSQTAAQANTLTNTINTLTTNGKKLGTQLDLTNQKVSATNLQISQLQIQIGDKQSKIKSGQAALADSIREVYESESNSFIGDFLANENMSVVWNNLESANQFQSSVKNNVKSLEGLQQTLQANVSDRQAQKDQLVSLQQQLTTEKTAVAANQKQEADLLVQTKSKESNYQKIIADKKAKEAAFQSELTQIESQLNLAINPNSIPNPNSGVLSWPMSGQHLVTQLFGDTSFSRTHVEAYSGKGHNGIDIGVPIGTPIMSAQDGVVKGTGNTDTACPGASFGKWVMIQHNNGLSTLYAHLSVIQASAGQQVHTGDVIGLSGMTGYATGPHLHFTVYASQGVEIISRASKSCNGSTYTLPVADLKAYLNPLLFLSSDYKLIN